ncbi:MAG: hypothetical protein M3Y72_11640 [Acidobacteriota bacterium]|nr:hypothetical protein [Acidobacteriota bacterium]
MRRASYKGGYEDLDMLRGRFEEFRSHGMPRTRLPEELWRAAAEVAGRRGVDLTARYLRLDTNHLKKWMGKQAAPPEPKPARKRAAAETPAGFLELLTPVSSSSANCIVEVESPRGGKLRMELKGVATSEIAQLIHLFAGH